MKQKVDIMDSSSIKSVEYDFNEHKLVVEFIGNSKYLYKDVPEKVVKDFFLAESKGKYFAKNIKNIYGTEKISESTNKSETYDYKLDKDVIWPFPPEGGSNMSEKKPLNVPSPVPIPEEDTFEEFIEWTPDEEEEFLKKIEKDESNNEGF